MSHSLPVALLCAAGCAEVYTPGDGADVGRVDAGGGVGAPAPPGETTGAGGQPTAPTPDAPRPERVDPAPPEEIPVADAAVPPSGRDLPLDAGLEPPPPPPAPPTSAPPEDQGPCQGIDFIGECQGSVLRYCDNGVLVVWDCTWSGEPCGWVDAATGYDCGGSGAGPDGGGGGGGNDPPPPVPPPIAPGSCGSAEETRVVELVNASRARNGLGALTCDAAAVQAARLHSQDQCRRGYMGHDGSDGSDAGDRMRREGGSFSAWGENVAYGASTPEGVHDMWMNSRGHYGNIMGNFGRIGVGLDVCGGTYYWTEAFMD